MPRKKPTKKPIKKPTKQPTKEPYILLLHIVVAIAELSNLIGVIYMYV